MVRARNYCYSVNRLVYNLTDKQITCYNGEGHFIELEPVYASTLPDYEFGVCYIVPEEVYFKAKTTGRSTKDLVHVIGKDAVAGRGGVKVVYLETYDNDSYGGKIHVAPGTKYSYEKNDPKEKTHHFLSV